jgi:hypothetical protein
MDTRIVHAVDGAGIPGVRNHGVFVTVIQSLIVLLNGTPNARLVTFGRSMGRYFKQIVDFLGIAAEEIPFPFNDWPPLRNSNDGNER